jgi:N-acyl-D-amino-acid deacylase
MWGKNKELIARLDRARAEGVRLTHDQYAYTASSTGIQQMIPSEARRAGRKKFAELLADPDKKKNLVDEMKINLRDKERDSYAYAVIAYHSHDKSLNGLNIVEAAQKRNGKAELNDQIELILDIEKNGGASGVFHGMNEDDVRAFIRSPFTMFASDSSVRVYKSGVPHPRGYGNAVRFLARYVREQKVIKLEEAVRRLTALPARTFKLKNRGELKPGYWADVVVFDPEKVQDRATFKEPHQYAQGFRLVLVNGVIVVENDKHNGAGPGRVIRGPGFVGGGKN